MISSGFLGGCNEQTEKAQGDIDKVELVRYSVVTYSYEKKLGNGFVNNEEAEVYVINGTVKNIAGYKLNKITIKARFFDSDGNFLDSLSDDVRDLPNTYEDDFQIIAQKYTIDYFDNVDRVEFKFSVS